MPKGPCVSCGREDYPLSMGGASICPTCDCGIPPEVTKLKAEVESLRSKLKEHGPCHGPEDCPEAGLREQLAADEKLIEHMGITISQHQESLDEKDAVICGMREALEVAHRVIHQGALTQGYVCAHQPCVIRDALSSSPTCPHKEEVEKRQHEVSRLQVQLADLQAELASLREVARAARLYRNTAIDDPAKFEGAWVAIPDEDFATLQNALTSHESKWPGKKEPLCHCTAEPAPHKAHWPKVEKEG